METQVRVWIRHPGGMGRVAKDCIELVSLMYDDESAVLCHMAFDRHMLQAGSKGKTALEAEANRGWCIHERSDHFHAAYGRPGQDSDYRQ